MASRHVLSQKCPGQKQSQATNCNASSELDSPWIRILYNIPVVPVCSTHRLLKMLEGHRRVQAGVECVVDKSGIRFDCGDDKPESGRRSGEARLGVERNLIIISCREYVVGVSHLRPWARGPKLLTSVSRPDLSLRLRCEATPRLVAFSHAWPFNQTFCLPVQSHRQMITMRICSSLDTESAAMHVHGKFSCSYCLACVT